MGSLDNGSGCCKQEYSLASDGNANKLILNTADKEITKSFLKEENNDIGFLTVSSFANDPVSVPS